MKKIMVLLAALSITAVLAGCAGTVAESSELSKEGTVSFSLESDLAQVAAKAKVLQDKLEKETLTQAEMNATAEELYRLWNDELNAVWALLQNKLPSDEMEKLTEEERTWIAEKEKAVQAAGAEVEDGSMQSLVTATEAAKWTEKRVYELAERLK